MRVRSRLVLGLCGLALSTPALAAPQDGLPAGPAAVSPSAGAPVLSLQPSAEMNPSPGAMPPAMASPSASPSAASPAAAASHPGMEAHHHHGLFGWRHCVQCQRAHARAVDGVDVPPPPGYLGVPAIALAPGETIVSGPVVVSERVVSVGEAREPGYAVVGGQESAPGYAVVNGPAQGNGPAPGVEPAPIGMARGAQGMPVDPRMAGAMSRPGGPYDPSVMQSSIPPAPAAMSGPGHDRPHIISHVFGLPKLGKLHEDRANKKRDQHAAIAYGDPNQKVNELPASVVYRQK
jgi:hypothetical protein